MAGFTNWIIENLQIATLPTAVLASMIVYAEPYAMFYYLGLTFVVSFLITCLVRLISIVIY